MKTDYLDVLTHCDTCTVPIGTRCESAPGSCPYSEPKTPENASESRKNLENDPK